MTAKIAYPWFFFFRVIQLALLTAIPALLALLYFDRKLFLNIFPFALAGYFLFVLLFYFAIRPLGAVLAKVQKFKSDIPYEKTLRHFYKKDEWAQVEEALNKADLRMKEQVLQTKSENEKISAILESINDHIIAIDPFESVLFFNTKFKRDFMTQRADIVPKLWHTFEDEAVLKAFRKVLKTGESLSIKAIYLNSSRLPNRWFDLTITSLKDVTGKVSGALGVFHDVTDFKLTEQMRVDFVANVSHEIRTPLTSIRGYTQILQSEKEKLTPELQLFLQKIVTNTERMISLFNDLLNLSVIESGRELSANEFDLEAVVDHVTDTINTNYPGKNIRLERDLAITNIRGDEGLLEQVLSNLSDNACKYADQQDVVIRISSRKSGEMARLEVADNGPGIPAEHIQRIFERFYRIDSSREASRGTGLGLSIVKHIIVKHGGKIWAENRNPGTAFIMELPLE